MAVVQEVFEIPDDIIDKIETGEYKRYGGIIRDSSGKIVKHLKRVELEKVKEKLNPVYKVALILKNNPVVIVAVIGVLILAVIGIVCSVIHHRRDKLIKTYHSSVIKYFIGVKNGTLSLEDIENLRSAIIKLENNKNDKAINELVTSEEFETVTSIVKDYTEKVRKANSYDYPDFIDLTTDDNIIVTSDCLRFQEYMFKVA